MDNAPAVYAHYVNAFVCRCKMLSTQEKSSAALVEGSSARMVFIKLQVVLVIRD